MKFLVISISILICCSCVTGNKDFYDKSSVIKEVSTKPQTLSEKDIEKELASIKEVRYTVNYKTKCQYPQVVLPDGSLKEYIACFSPNDSKIYMFREEDYNSQKKEIMAVLLPIRIPQRTRPNEIISHYTLKIDTTPEKIKREFVKKDISLPVTVVFESGQFQLTDMNGINYKISWILNSWQKELGFASKCYISGKLTLNNNKKTCYLIKDGDKLKVVYKKK